MAGVVCPDEFHARVREAIRPGAGRAPGGTAPYAGGEANLSRTLRVADVAAAVGYSPDHLSRLFSRYLGSAFSVHLEAMRMTAAKDLLEERDLSVREMAQSVGYTHASNFSHAFAPATGLSPREYRRHLAGQ